MPRFVGDRGYRPPHASSADAPRPTATRHRDLAIDVAARVFLVEDAESLPPDAPDDAETPLETILMLSAGFRVP